MKFEHGIFHPTEGVPVYPAPAWVGGETGDGFQKWALGGGAMTSKGPHFWEEGGSGSGRVPNRELLIGT